jgi:hypothetical protein
MKSFLNNISCNISMGGIVTKEQAISHAQYLNLIYSQTGTLYDLLHDVPCPSTTATSTTPVASHATDDVIGTFQTQPQNTQASPTNPNSNASNVQNSSSPTPTRKTSKVNYVQSTPTGKNKYKKLTGKNKEDKNYPQSEKAKTQPAEDKDKRKP